MMVCGCCSHPCIVLRLNAILVLIITPTHHCDLLYFAGPLPFIHALLHEIYSFTLLLIILSFSLCYILLIFSMIPTTTIRFSECNYRMNIFSFFEVVSHHVSVSTVFYGLVITAMAYIALISPLAVDNKRTVKLNLGISNTGNNGASIRRKSKTS
jgi:hypothetical protein